MKSKKKIETSETEKVEKTPVSKYFQICYNISEGRIVPELEQSDASDGQQTFSRSIEVIAHNAKQVREKAFNIIVKSLKHFDCVSKIAITQIIQTDLSKFYNKGQLKRLVDLTK